MKFYLIFVAVAFLAYCNACETDDDCPSDQQCSQEECVDRCTQEAYENCVVKKGPYTQCILVWGYPYCTCRYGLTDGGECCDHDDSEDDTEDC